MIEIKKWTTGEVMHSGDFADIKECLEDGVKKGISFNGADLNYVELNGAKLNGAKLNYVELNGAKLNGAKLNGAELNGAELNRAELTGADLNGAKLNGAELNCAELPDLSVCICSGEEYWLFISPDVVQAGCQYHSPSEWRAMTKKQIADMDGRKALKYYPRLLELMDIFLGKGEKPEWIQV